jgi:hypothetical protein
MTDGLTLTELSNETASLVRRDATVIAILPKVDDEVIVTLSSLRARGFSVSAILNIHSDTEFAEAAGALLAIRIDAMQLVDESSIRTVCQHFMLR